MTEPRASRLSRRSAVAVAMLLIAGLTADARGQSNLPLQIEVDYPSNVARTCGPIRLQMTFTWSGPGVFHGDLQLEARDSARELLGVFRVDNVYLTEGEQALEIMLPGFRVATLDDSITLTPTLIAAETGRQMRHRDLQVLVPSDQKRELVVAIVSPESLLADRRENDIVDALRLERLAPPEVDSPHLLTKAVDWRAEDAPQDPLRYCACDIVLLPAGGLKLLEDPHLEALLAWVRAGGGVCVLIDGTELEPEHVAWLNTLVAAPDATPTFLRDSQGRLIHELNEAAETSLQYRCGLGRAVVVVGRDQAHPRAPHWKHAAAFLWRVRYEHLPRIVSHGEWNHQLTLASAQRAPQLGTTGYGNVEVAQQVLAADFQPQPTLGLTGLIQRLLPDGIRLVPLSTMGLLLLAYLIAIGPLDYFILGKLGLRRWTWCTFPAVTLLFTAFSIGLSNRSMSTTVLRRSAVIRDVAPGGIVARENRLELLFPSSSRVMTTDVGRGLFMPTRYQEFAQFQQVYYDPRTMQTQAQRAQPAAFRGRMPIQCSVDQVIPQWTPQLNRTLTIPLQQPADLPDFDWDEVPDFKTPEGLQQLRSRIEKSFSVPLTDRLYSGITDPVAAGVLHAGDSTPLLGNSSLFQTQLNQQVLVNTPYGQQWVQQTDTYLRQLSVGNQSGFLGVVSEYAPAGGDRFEDMLLLDPTNPRQWLLVIVQPRGTDVLIYRRLYVLEY